MSQFSCSLWPSPLVPLAQSSCSPRLSPPGYFASVLLLPWPTTCILPLAQSSCYPGPVFLLSLAQSLLPLAQSLLPLAQSSCSPGPVLLLSLVDWAKGSRHTGPGEEQANWAKGAADRLEQGVAGRLEQGEQAE